MLLKTGDIVIYKDEIATVLEHTLDHLIILVKGPLKLNEIEIKITEIKLFNC
jgi:hypothetical protein